MGLALNIMHCFEWSLDPEFGFGFRVWVQIQSLGSSSEFGFGFGFRFRVPEFMWTRLQQVGCCADSAFTSIFDNRQWVHCEM